MVIFKKADTSVYNTDHLLSPAYGRWCVVCEQHSVPCAFCTGHAVLIRHHINPDLKKQ